MDTPEMNFSIEKETVDCEPHYIELPKYNPDDYEEPNPEKYFTHHCREWKPSPCRVWTSLPVLEFLTGKPWGHVALACVSGLKPTSIRVTTGQITLDSRVGRVTVYVNEDNTIRKIEQEMELSVPKHIANGSALRMAIQYGEDSEQCQWYNDDNVEFYSAGLGGYYKHLKDGTSVPFPKSKKE